MHPDLEHLSDELIQATLHDELGEGERTVIERHLDACDHCAGRLEDEAANEKAVFGLLEHLDETSPIPDPHSIARRARRSSQRPLRWAAAILLTLMGAGAAYAAPGSPLRGFVDRLFPGAETGPTEVLPELAPQETGPLGIVLSMSPRLVVRFASYQQGGVARVSIEEGTGIMVETTSGSAAFDSDVDVLTVTATSEAPSFRITIPPEALVVEIWVEDDRVFQKLGGELEGGILDGAGDARVIDLGARVR